MYFKEGIKRKTFSEESDELMCKDSTAIAILPLLELEDMTVEVHAT